MEYGNILSRSVSIVWQNKFLIFLGILVSLASGPMANGGGGGGSNSGGSGFTGEFDQSFTEFGDEIAALAVGFIIALICVFLIIGIVVWAISTIARGGLIAGVDTIESGEKSGFRQAWGAGWHRGWTLLGIGVLPAIPGLILFVGGLIALGVYGGLFALFDEQFANIGGAGIGVALFLVACIVVPVMLVLSILRNFAERACMLEDLGVVDSYRRGTSVLMANLGEAIILLVLQIVIFIGLGIALFVPGIISVLCCCLWPLIIVVQGAISAFLSTLWTLAWRTWTIEPILVEKSPTAI